MRKLTNELPALAGKSVTIEGWLHKKRLLGGINFIMLRDRGGVAQIKVEDEVEVEKLRALQIGTVLEISGKVTKDQRAPGGVEVHDPQIVITVPIEETPPIEIDKPIDHTPDNLDTLFDNRVYNLRNLDEQSIFRLRAVINRCIREYLSHHQFVEIQTPKLLAGATEGGAEVFKTDYFGQEATLAQSPQFYKQIMVGVFERVFEIGPAFRAEPSMTTRHMSEVSMLDIEMGFIKSHQDVLEFTEQFFGHLLKQLYKDQSSRLEQLKAPKLRISDKFPRFSVAEVHQLYKAHHKEDFSSEKDLAPAEERWICEHALKDHGSEAVFITDFPRAAGKFYHMVNPDNPETVLMADLLFRGVEVATIPQREHRYDVLVEQIKAAGIDPDHPGFKYYLQAFKAGLPPHGGFGFGIDRFTQTVLGLKNVKEATLFPRDLKRLAP
jgi:nondiscriminating aspartyl-tRNA synthetase